MVCSQVYSQHPSRRLLSVAHQGRSWGSSYAEMRFLEAETGEGDCKGNFTCNGNLRPSEGYVCSEYASTLSPIKSSWIQRLIPADVTRVEQPQLTKTLPIERECLDGFQADWSHDAVLNSSNGNQSGFALHKNSSRSRQDFSGRHMLGNTTTCNEHVGVHVPPTSRSVKPLDALQPKIQVPPRTLPVVECLLNTGCTKKSLDAQVSMETNKPQDFFKCSGFSHPIKQTVRFSADERSRVSCSSIEGLNFRSGRRAAGNLNALPLGEKCFNVSQPTLESSFNRPEAASRSNLDLFYGGRKAQNCTYPGMDFTNGPQRQEQIVSNRSESRDPVSFTGWPSMERRYRVEESRSLEMHPMPYKARCIESFSECFMQANIAPARTEEGLNADKKSMQTLSNRDLGQGHLQEEDCGRGTIFAFEFSSGKGSAFSGEAFSNPGLGKDGSKCTSDLVSAHVREKASISLAPCLIKQELSSSQETRREQDATSGSFSFCSRSKLPYGSADAKMVTKRRHWPFCETTPYLEDLAQARLPKDLRSRDLVEPSRLEVSFDNVSTTQHEVDYAYFSRSQYSPFFGTEPLTEYGKHRLASEDDFRRYKPTCVDNEGAYTGELETEALFKCEVNQDAGVKQEKARQQNDGIIFPRIQCDPIIQGMEEREQKHSHPSRAIGRMNWEGFKPHFRINTLRVGSIESCLKRPADLGTEDLATNVEARNTLAMLEDPVALPSVRLQEHSDSFSVGGGLHKAAHAPESQERGSKRSGIRKNMWLKRWSTTSPCEERALLKSNRERSRRSVGNDYSTSQSSWESSHHFDLRPAKRACYGQRFGLHSDPYQAIPAMGTVAVGRESQQGFGAASHFMKRFLGPSAAAMAIMGMAARKVHATKSQRGGLFGAWPVNFSTHKSLTSQVEASKDFLTRHKNKKEFLHSSEKPSSTQVDA